MTKLVGTAKHSSVLQNDPPSACFISRETALVGAAPETPYWSHRRCDFAPAPVRNIIACWSMLVNILASRSKLSSLSPR